MKAAGKRWLCLLLLAAGLWWGEGKEMEERQLISVLAVDGSGPVTVTGLVASRETDPTGELLSASGESFAGACIALHRADLKENYLGQTRRLLLGGETSLETVLDHVLHSRELRLDTLLALVEGRAGEALAASAGQRATESGGRDPRGQTVGAVLARLRGGEAVTVPLLEIGSDGVLQPAGWRILTPDGVGQDLTGVAGEGCDLLSVGAMGQAAELPGGTVRIEKMTTHAKEDGLLFCLEGSVEEGSPTEGELERWGVQRLSGAVAQGEDCWDLEKHWKLCHPLRPGMALGEMKIHVKGVLRDDRTRRATG